MGENAWAGTACQRARYRPTIIFAFRIMECSGRRTASWC
jgi:hypothetical protein